MFIHCCHDYGPTTCFQRGNLLAFYSAHQKSGDRIKELCCYNIYMCIKIKKNNDVNDFYLIFNCTYMHSRHAEAIFEIYIMAVVLKFQNSCMCPQNYHWV